MGDAGGQLAEHGKLGRLHQFVLCGAQGLFGAPTFADFVLEFANRRRKVGGAGGDAVAEQFACRVTNGTTDSPANLTINIVDDAPVGSDVSYTLQAASASLTYNLVLVIDVSGSMAWDANGRSSGQAGFDPNTVRMDIAKAALEKAVKDPDPGVAQAAMKALKALGG